MLKNLRYSLIILGIWSLVIGVSFASVDVYLLPTSAANIVNNTVTYTITVQADKDTRLEGLGDIFFAYDKNCLTLVTTNIEDLSNTIQWSASVTSYDYTISKLNVSSNAGVIRFAKISLAEKFVLTANVPVQVLRLPFLINVNFPGAMTRLYFPKVLMVDEQHKNVLRNAADSFLIKQLGTPKRSVVKKKVQKRQ